MRNEFKQHSFGGYSVAINVGTDLWGTPLKWLHAAWCTYQIPRRLVQVFPQQFENCDVGITDEMDLLCAPLKWAQVAWYTHQVPLQSVQAFK
jgi:hypothetical protein